MLQERFVIRDEVLLEYRGKEEIVSIPEEIISIGEYAFAKCEFIKEIKRLEGVEELSEGCFRFCIHLEKLKLLLVLRR